jgi:hypothetical protein
MALLGRAAADRERERRVGVDAAVEGNGEPNRHGTQCRVARDNSFDVTMRGMRTSIGLCVLALAIPAHADSSSPDRDVAPPQLQADVGLSVVLLGYERPITDHVAVAAGAGIFGTYFLPWFDRGEDVIGLAIGARATWYARTDGHGLYVAPYVRGVGVRGERDGMSGTGLGFTTGAFVGWAFALTRRLDLRAGIGAQYIRTSFHVTAGDVQTSTPFVALDLVVGYRL